MHRGLTIVMSGGAPGHALLTRPYHTMYSYVPPPLRAPCATLASPRGCLPLHTGAAEAQLGQSLYLAGERLSLADIPLGWCVRVYPSI